MTDAAHRILIVEGQPQIAADIETTLKRLGYDVVGTASSGQSAIGMADQLRPELVLMGVGEEQDGIRAAAVIRERFEIPVVLLTDKADDESIVRATKTTPFGYLVKPFTERELRTTIELTVYSHQMERTLADERARRQSAEELRLLIDGVKDYAIFMLDASGRITTWNSGAERLAGYKPAEVIGKDFSMLYTEEARRAGQPTILLETALREGRFEEENWHVRKDGTKFWANVIVTAIRNEESVLVGFAEVTRDLTERRSAEQKRDAARIEAARVMSESEETFRLLVDGVHDYAIVFLDPVGHVMTWNAGAERIHGYRADEIVGQSFVRFYLAQDVIAGVPMRVLRRATEQGVATDEGERTRKDGSTFWASVVLTALRDKSGKLRGFSTVTRDTSDQRHVEQAMAMLADTSRLLAESLDPEQILFTITHMAVPAFADAVSIHMRDRKGDLQLALYHAANPELLAAIADLQRKGTYRVASPSRRVMRTGRSELHPRITEEWLAAEDMNGDLMPLIKKFGNPSTIFVPILVKGRPYAVIVFATVPPRVYAERDVVFAEELARRASTAMQNAELYETAKRERERAEEAAALRERLVAVVGHDLRTPLTSIIMGTQMLASSSLPAGDAQLVRRIEISANRMARMITQILDFARIRSGQSFELELEQADLKDTCRAAIDELRLSKPNAEIALSIEGATDAVFDQDRIAQVMSNLIGNAIQYGSRGPITVTVRDANADTVSIDVHNIGPPIALDLQRNIFEAFRRETKPGKQDASVGLGLFIAHEIVRAHGGTIALRSPDRNGSTFSVLLPRGHLEVRQSATESEQPQIH